MAVGECDSLARVAAFARADSGEDLRGGLEVDAAYDAVADREGEGDLGLAAVEPCRCGTFVEEDRQGRVCRPVEEGGDLEATVEVFRRAERDGRGVGGDDDAGRQQLEQSAEVPRRERRP